MKKLFKTLIATSCAALSLFSYTACNSSTVEPKASVLGEPKAVTAISYEERQAEKVKSISKSAEAFAAELAATAYKDYDKSKNFVLAPVSVYMALSLAAQCSEENTRTEILSALGVTYEQQTAVFQITTVHCSMKVNATEKLRNLQLLLIRSGLITGLKRIKIVLIYLLTIIIAILIKRIFSMIMKPQMPLCRNS